MVPLWAKIQVSSGSELWRFIFVAEEFEQRVQQLRGALDAQGSRWSFALQAGEYVLSYRLRDIWILFFPVFVFRR